MMLTRCIHSWSASLAAAAAALLLSACAPAGPMISRDQPGGSKSVKIGLINNLSDRMISYNYGTFAGLSQWYFTVPAPFDVGGEFLAKLKARIEARGVTAIIVPTPDEIADTRPDLSKLGTSEYRTPTWEWFDGTRQQVRTDVGATLTKLAAADGITMFIVTSGWSEYPQENSYLPPIYSYGVYAKEHVPFAGFKYAFMAVGCVSVDVKTGKTDIICKAANTLELKDYKGPQKAGDPIPRMDEITQDLHALIDLRARAAADRLFGAAAQ